MWRHNGAAQGRIISERALIIFSCSSPLVGLGDAAPPPTHTHPKFHTKRKREKNKGKERGKGLKKLNYFPDIM